MIKKLTWFRETLQEILYIETEHGDGYENELQDFDDGNGEGRKGPSLEMVVADVDDPGQDDAAAAAASGDDQDLNFIDDDMTE